METGWIDWVSRQTDYAARGVFIWHVGKYSPSLNGPFYISHYFVLLHDAGAAILTPDDHIMENGGAQIHAGARSEPKNIPGFIIHRGRRHGFAWSGRGR